MAKRRAKTWQTPGKHLATNKNDNNVKNEKKINNYSVDFESFWKCYPRRKEKAKAYRCYQTRLKEGYQVEDMITAARLYAEECRTMNREERYIKLAATFLGPDKPFEDYIHKQREATVEVKATLEGGRKLE